MGDAFDSSTSEMEIDLSSSLTPEDILAVRDEWGPALQEWNQEFEQLVDDMEDSDYGIADRSESDRLQMAVSDRLPFVRQEGIQLGVGASGGTQLKERRIGEMSGLFVLEAEMMDGIRTNPDDDVKAMRLYFDDDSTTATTTTTADRCYSSSTVGLPHSTPETMTTDDESLIIDTGIYSEDWTRKDSVPFRDTPLVIPRQDVKPPKISVSDPNMRIKVTRKAQEKKRKFKLRQNETAVEQARTDVTYEGKPQSPIVACAPDTDEMVYSLNREYSFQMPKTAGSSPREPLVRFPISDKILKSLDVELLPSLSRPAIAPQGHLFSGTFFVGTEDQHPSRKQMNQLIMGKISYGTTRKPIHNIEDPSGPWGCKVPWTATISDNVRDIKWFDRDIVMFASGSRVGALKLGENGIPSECMMMPITHIADIRELAPSPFHSNYIATASFDGTVVVMDYPQVVSDITNKKGRTTVCVYRVQDPVGSIVWNPSDANICSCTTDNGGFYLFDIRTDPSKRSKTYYHNTKKEELYTHGYLSDSLVALGFGDGVICCLDTRVNSRVLSICDPAVHAVGDILFDADTMVTFGAPGASFWAKHENNFIYSGHHSIRDYKPITRVSGRSPEGAKCTGVPWKCPFIDANTVVVTDSRGDLCVYV